MTKEEIQNLKDSLGLNQVDENLPSAGIKLKRVFELLEQAQVEIERLNNELKGPKNICFNMLKTLINSADIKEAVDAKVVITDNEGRNHNFHLDWQ